MRVSEGRLSCRSRSPQSPGNRLVYSALRGGSVRNALPRHERGYSRPCHFHVLGFSGKTVSQGQSPKWRKPTTEKPRTPKGEVARDDRGSEEPYFAYSFIRRSLELMGRGNEGRLCPLTCSVLIYTHRGKLRTT